MANETLLSGYIAMEWAYGMEPISRAGHSSRNLPASSYDFFFDSFDIYGDSFSPFRDFFCKSLDIYGDSLSLF
ncbi:MAG: hypothetical protein LBI77_00475 [Puniceicoccales bacterium]|nr:hypothetical protein [Puniceicoccales bacterium]